MSELELLELLQFHVELVIADHGLVQHIIPVIVVPEFLPDGRVLYSTWRNHGTYHGRSGVFGLQTVQWDGCGVWTFDDADDMEFDVGATDFDGEEIDQRLERRASNWIPTVRISFSAIWVAKELVPGAMKSLSMGWPRYGFVRPPADHAKRASTTASADWR